MQFIKGRQFSFVRPLEGPNVRNARANEFPFVVSIMRLKSGQYLQPENDHVCTGSLITLRDVATAAHCVVNEMKISIRIIIGSTDIRLGQRYYPFWWLTYDVWAHRKGIQPQVDFNDIVNIRLTAAVPNSIVPAEIPNIPNARLNRLQVIAVAWGILNGTHTNPFLKAANLQVISYRRSLEIIGSSYQPLDIIETPSLLTYMQPHVILSYGDSGGPLLYRHQLVGIHSGVCPKNQEVDNNHLINVHASMHYYRAFFLDVRYSGN
ncbi:PREDICTED: trypsin-4-like [Ceratosolen solmsi marchali]|uniref:Trypsin-4-like n=1 Tax=Ceratosolen solmsi marchali TaxID=326594 RepID=A0AAJ7E0P4_9HYME|nr:PREDICTED: trypsin-4-like [Ceratosolen solmsi marchali]